MKKIILASASPRRRELLTQIGLEFEIIPSHKDEVIGSEGPADTVMALAAGKAEDIYAQVCSGRAPEDVLVIGADTVVAMDGLILGKPADAAQASETSGKDPSGVYRRLPDDGRRMPDIL